MDDSEIARTLDFILAHEAPVVFGDPAEDIKEALGRLREVGDAAVPQVVSQVTVRAAGSSGGPYWWDGASQLCKVLGQLGTPACEDALLTILKTDSRIVEFDRVRSEAATQLANFRSPRLIAELLACLKMANAPILAINKTVEALGGEVSTSPEVVIEEGRGIDDPKKAVAYFGQYEQQVPQWPVLNQGGFYFFAARKVEKAYGHDAALPVYAAALLANPDPNTAAWQSFPNERPSPQGARALAEKHPMPVGYLTRLSSGVIPAYLKVLKVLLAGLGCVVGPLMLLFAVLFPVVFFMDDSVDPYRAYGTVAILLMAFVLGTVGFLVARRAWRVITGAAVAR